MAEAVMAGAVARGQGLGVSLAQIPWTRLELSLGHYDEARIHALAVFEKDPLYVGTMALADAVEVTVRSGDTNSARAALARLSERAEAGGAARGLDLLTRARALLAEDRDAEALYEESLDHLARSGVATALARSRLLYGEWLRRRRGRRDARVQLRAANEMFLAMDAEAWANRACVELGATGELARARARNARPAQEQQVAQLAAEGESNAEIGAQLFISPHTVAYHLRKVFSKLDVTSRTQLAMALRDQLDAPALSGSA
jgi:DNA-binding CsgD family transcriptional regulator